MNQSPDVDTIVAFITTQMDGAVAPPAEGADIARLAAAIKAIQARASDDEMSMLGLRALGAVIDRARAGIQAEATLRAFIQPGRRE